METHDTFDDLGRGTPAWFTFSARILPVGILGQFLTAGRALFRDAGMWDVHAAMGGTLVLPAAALLVGAVSVRRLRGFGWWAGTLFVLFLIQIALAAGSVPLPLSFHPFNAGLLLTASLILLAKVERRRAQPPSVETVQ